MEMISNKTEEDLVSDKMLMRLPGMAITFFAGFFVLRELGVDYLNLGFSICYLVFFGGIVFLLSVFKKNREVIPAIIISALLLILIYRDRMLTISILIPLGGILLFIILSSGRLERAGFMVLMTANIIFWLVRGTNDKLTVVVLVTGTVYAIGRLIHKNADYKAFAIILLLVIAFLPVKDSPVRWTFIRNIADRVASAFDWIADEVGYRFGDDKMSYVGYSGEGSISGPVEVSSKEELIFDRVNSIRGVYLKGAQFKTLRAEGFFDKESFSGDYNKWIFEYMNALMNAGITPEEAKCFSRIENAKVEYRYIKTSDIIYPQNLLKIDDKLKNGLSEKKGKGFSYSLQYMNVDYASPYFLKIINVVSDPQYEGKVYTYDEVKDYVDNVYHVNLSSYMTRAEYEELEEQALDLAEKRKQQSGSNGAGSENNSEKSGSSKNSGQTESGAAGGGKGSEKAGTDGTGSKSSEQSGADGTENTQSERIWSEDMEAYLDASMATDRTIEFTRELTSLCKNDYERAKVIESYLRTFKYDNYEDLRGSENFIDQFLFDDRKGYCVHFASTMALMLRISGVPSRYVSGYHFTDPGNFVMGSCAHAWVEAYIDGVGWVPFEPTPVNENAEQLSWGLLVRQEDERITDWGKFYEDKISEYLDEQEEDEGGKVIVEDTDPDSHKEKENVIRLMFIYLSIIVGSAAVLLLLWLGISRIIFLRLSPEKKLRELVKKECRGIEKKIRADEEKAALRANSASLYDYLKYAEDETKSKRLKCMFDMYYLVRYRGNSITDQDLKDMNIL